MSDSRLRWPVDGHVHFHELDRVAPTLDAAATNFRAVRPSSDGLLGALLLSQTVGETVFEELLGAGHAGEWTFSQVRGEEESLIARRGHWAVVIVCGRQVRTSNGLEILALGTRDVFADGLPFAESVNAVQKSGALTVLPWGFGKWTGARRRQVESALNADTGRGLLLGDNGGRPWLMGSPSLIRRYRQRGFGVLPGTDPLWLSTDHRRAGSFGFLAEIAPNETAPWRELRAWIATAGASLESYGRACGAVRFTLNQLGLRLNRRPVSAAR